MHVNEKKSYGYSVDFISVVSVLYLFSVIAIFVIIPQFNGVSSYTNEPVDKHEERQPDPELNPSIQSLMVVQAIEVIKVNLRESYGLDRKKADDFAQWIHGAHLETGVPVGHLASLIATESSFRYQAQSSAGALGPAQVMPQFWESVCQADLMDPEANILCGAKVLKLYKDQCTDWECAFAKYNVGPSNFQKDEYRGAMGRYLSKIRSYQELFASLYTGFGTEVAELKLVAKLP